MKKENTIDGIQFLKDYYGNHSLVAEKLGITARHYRSLRRTGFDNSPQTLSHIKSLVQLIEVTRRADG
jgi:hypothetical protein